LVLTGYGTLAVQEIDPSIARFASLVEAVDYILRQEGSEDASA
jgi:hypothetical protein